MFLRRRELLPGVFLNTLQTDKFKSDCLSVNLLTQLSRETISKNALLPRVLLRGSAFHPDMDAINAACDELYGATVLPTVRKMGEILSIGLYAGFIADRFTPDGAALLEPTAQLLGELLLSPATRGGLLLKDYVESEKEKLIDDIRAKINDKGNYAVGRLIEEMCAYEDYGCDDLGSEEDAAAVGYVELTRYYRDLLRSAPIEIFYCGAHSEEEAARALRDALITLPRGEINYDLGTDIRMNSVDAEPRYVEQALDVTQGKLCLGFRLGECMEDPDFAAISVFNAMYGGAVTSRLFLNVREKLSLCYYASSYCDRHKGVMVVSSGIEFESFDAAKAEILAQLEELRCGNFTEEELQNARKAVAGVCRAMTDSPGALEGFYLSQCLCGLDYGPAEMAELCESVTRRDVLRVASDIQLDTVYFLRGAEADEEEEEEATDDAEA